MEFMWNIQYTNTSTDKNNRIPTTANRKKRTLTRRAKKMLKKNLFVKLHWSADGQILWKLWICINAVCVFECVCVSVCTRPKGPAVQHLLRIFLVICCSSFSFNDGANSHAYFANSNGIEHKTELHYSSIKKLIDFFWLVRLEINEASHSEHFDLGKYFIR